MSRTRLPLAAAVGLAATLAAVPAADGAAVRAGIRVATAKRTLLEAPLVGAARSFVSTDGNVSTLPANTALGQLETATAFFGVNVGVTTGQYGAFVSSIAGRRPDPARGYWALFVNERYATSGAADVRLRPGDAVTWILDDDFKTPGPSWLDLHARRTRRGLHLRVTLVEQAGQTWKAVPARGARVLLNGRRVGVANAAGTVDAPAPGRPWQAVAVEPGVVPSGTVVGAR